MKKVICALILSLVVSGLVFANREIKNEASKKPFSIADRKAGREDLKKWEASPDGKKFKKWEASPEGKKVHASADKIRKYIKAFTNMEAVVTSLSIPSPASGNSSGLKGVMVRIDSEVYIMQLDQDFLQLHSLKVNDKIVVRSHSAGYSPNYPYYIIWGDYIEQNSKIVFKRNFRNGGC